MECIICGSPSAYYFSKSYADGEFADMMSAIGPVAYFRCEGCGFVLSKTHSELAEADWIALNSAFHHRNEDPSVPRSHNQPPYLEQAAMIALLGRHGLISTEGMIDYAGGYGTLSKLLARYFGLTLPIFDPFVQGNGDAYLSSLPPESCQTVVNSAMFEHVLARSHLDAVNEAVAPEGSLIIHTVVCENVPPDPNWFYLVPPVHSAFHTNRSMAELMCQWGYASSIYCPPAKCWVLLRGEGPLIEREVAALNEELQAEWFIWKRGFVDYWKGF